MKDEPEMSARCEVRGAKNTGCLDFLDLPDLPDSFPLSLSFRVETHAMVSLDPVTSRGL